MGNYIQDWEGHKSDFHNVTQYGCKMCHATVTGVTGDTTCHECDRQLYLESYLRRHVLKFPIAKDWIKTLVHAYSKVYGQYYYKLL